MSSNTGANIKNARLARGWSQGRLAREACRAAGIIGDPLGRQEISRYENGKRNPREWLPFIAEALGLSVGELRAVPEMEIPSHQRRDDYAESIRETSRRLVALDNEMHGLPIADIAGRAFKKVHRRIGIGDYDTAYERDIHAAAAELAEIAGWAFYNEGKFGLSRRFNHEALLLARLSGDRSAELLTLQNTGLVAGWSGRPREELSITRSVLESERLSPRIEAMFRTREAGGLARSGGSMVDSCKLFDRARALLQESPAERDPHWAWWVTDREIDRQQGRALTETRQWREAIPVLERAMEPEAGNVGYRNVASVWRLSCLLEVRAWREAEAEAERLRAAIGEMSSKVSLDILAKNADRASRASTTPGSLRDGLRQIVNQINEDPYEL